MNPSVRDLELLDPATLSGRRELRTLLEEEFRIEPLVVDWILHSFSDLEIQIRDLEIKLKHQFD
jgi:hypothetical protein